MIAEIACRINSFFTVIAAYFTDNYYSSNSIFYTEAVAKRQ
jgi:hypothetical protein